MDNKGIKGIAVISVADAERLGVVTRAYVDPAEKRVVGFVVDHGSGLMSPDAAVIVDATQVHSLGPDALMVADESALTGSETERRFDSLVDLDSLVHHRVVTEGGTQIGQVASVSFDPHSFALTEIEASPGFFKTNMRVPLDQITAIGSELVVVDDAVCGDTAPAASEATSAEAEPQPFQRVIETREPADPGDAPAS